MNTKLKILFDDFDEFIKNNHENLNQTELNHQEIAQLAKFGCDLHESLEKHPNKIEEINKRAFKLRDIGRKYMKKISRSS